MQCIGIKTNNSAFFHLIFKTPSRFIFSALAVTALMFKILINDALSFSTYANKPTLLNDGKYETTRAQNIDSKTYIKVVNIMKTRTFR